MNDHLLLTGGGTLGPVTPLLPVAAEWRKRFPAAKISWVGTHNGPEKSLIEAAKYDFYSLNAPKFDRTRLWRWFFIGPHFLWSFFKAWQLLKELEPGAVVSAGAYVSVPLAYAAYFLKIPVYLHQLDVVPGLANKLMAPFAKSIGVTWLESIKHFPKHKTKLRGAMVRSVMKVGEKDLALARYDFRADMPTLLVMGGSTGAQSLNELMSIIAQDLRGKMNVLHLTGAKKMPPSLREPKDNYVALEFLQEGLADAYAAADVVVARAGMGTIFELALLGKPAILIPLPGTHQLQNALALKEAAAAQVLTDLSPQTLLQAIMRLQNSAEMKLELSNKIAHLFKFNGQEELVNEIAIDLGL